jgi:hypothetical protein
MKTFALVIACALLATVSASAAEISTAAPAMPALEQPAVLAPRLERHLYRFSVAAWRRMVCPTAS